MELRGASIADKNHFGGNFDFIADADAETYFFRIISAMNLDAQQQGRHMAHVKFREENQYKHELFGPDFPWIFERGEKTPTPKVSALVRNGPFY